MANHDDREPVRSTSGGGGACLIVGVVLFLLLGVGVIGGGFFLYRMKRSAQMEEMEAQYAAEVAREEAMQRRREEALVAERLALEEAEARKAREAERLRNVSQPNPRMSPLRPRGAFSASLVKVVSGDTLALQIDDAQTPVRLIGVKSPAPGNPGHQEATDALKTLCKNRPLFLAPDAEVDRRDAKGRALYWLWAGTQLVNLEMLRQGHGQLSTEHGHGRYEQQLRNVQK